MDDFYRENILDHGMNPRNRGVLDPATIDVEANNPLCGDHLRLTLQIEDDRVVALAWDGTGCAISQAGASMLGEEILGKTLDEIRQVGKQDVLDMLGIPLSMNRVKCGLLALKVLTIGLYGIDSWHKLAHEDDEA